MFNGPKPPVCGLSTCSQYRLLKVVCKTVPFTKSSSSKSHSMRYLTNLVCFILLVFPPFHFHKAHALSNWRPVFVCVFSFAWVCFLNFFASYPMWVWSLTFFSSTVFLLVVCNYFHSGGVYGGRHRELFWVFMIRPFRSFFAPPSTFCFFKSTLFGFSFDSRSLIFLFRLRPLSRLASFLLD